LAHWTVRPELLIVSSSLTVDAISRFVGFAPTYGLERGAIRRSGTNPAAKTVWSYTKNDVEDGEMEPAVRTLLADLRADLDFRKLGDGKSACVSLCCHARTTMPPLVFPNELLEEVARLGLSLDIDVIQIGTGNNELDSGQIAGESDPEEPDNP
jgi:hypothetical protein